MSADDRFEGLGGDGGGAERREEIGKRLEERDRTHPEPDDPSGPRRPPDVPRPGNKYAWVVGILAVMALGVILFTSTLPDRGESLQGPRNGAVMPDFAAPRAGGRLQGEANVCARRPCNERAGPVPACDVRQEDVVNVCELRKQPVVLTFVVTRGADCEPQVDRVERVRREFPQVRFAVIMSGNTVPEVGRIARRRGWREPVGVDEDGAVVNLYGVGVCPTTVFARAGGKVAESVLGNLTEDQLRQKTRRLVSGS